MVHQNWLHNPKWELIDPKLRYLSKLSVQLPHTSRLAESINIQPAGILFVRGPRQAGKSTFLRQFIVKALREGIPPERIGLIEAESFDSRHELLGEIKKFYSTNDNFSILAIDEITSIDKWWLTLKIMADEGLSEKLLILCTGSSAINLAEGADMLPGRRGKRYPLDFGLFPVRFADISTHLSLESYFLTGGFPWAINEFLQSGCIPPYVYELYGAWIQGVLIKKNHSVHHLPSILNYTVKRLGTGLSVSSMARDCNIGSNHTAEGYLSTLELNYIIMISHWTEPGSNRIAPRKNRKFYPADPFLFHLFYESSKAYTFSFENSENRIKDPDTLGAIVECVVASELRHHPSMYPLRYFIGKKEIDFMGNQAVEVKYQNHASIEEFEWVEKVLPKDISFTVITKNNTSVRGRIRLVTLYDWLLEKKN